MVNLFSKWSIGKCRERRANKIVDRKNALEIFKGEMNIDDHIISLSDCVMRYSTNLTYGLNINTAADRLKVNGPNMLQPPKTTSRIVIFMEHMFLGFSLLLWIGVVLSLVGFTISKLHDSEADYDQIYLAVVIFVIIVFTGVFGYHQEASNKSIMESFRNMIPKTATVIREGYAKIISSEEIVIGDIVIINAGDCVPADMRIFEASSLKVDNSSITGESDPQPRYIESTDLNPLETANLAFYGTDVIEGSGTGLVIACGDATLMGHIAGLTSRLVPDETPIKKELRRFVKIITVLAVFMGSAFFFVAITMGYGFFESFIYFIAIAVANVPEGLLVTMTACLTLTSRKMAKKNCLCKNLHAIETLGSTTVICSDKTGTLTQNRMTVSHMYYDGVIVDILSENFKKIDTSAFVALCRVATLCSRAEFELHQENIPVMSRKVIGDASETAVLKCMELLNGKTDNFRNKHRKIFEIPFNSTNKYQLSIHTVPLVKHCILVIKGAPERILDRCIDMYSNEKSIQLNDHLRKKLQMALLELGYMGERVLGFADLELPNPPFNEHYDYDADNVNFPITDLRFLGFMSMIDPPRPGVTAAVTKCKQAGIKVIMVTGDHPITAMSIAKKVGIISVENETPYDIAMRRNVSVSKVTEEEIAHCNAAIVSGADLREMSEAELADIAEKYDEIVFARTSPQQKLQIVEAFQKLDAIVAVTGDGVNDSPALKKADIGIAMGLSGSDVSKDAADMIILDDNFASIVVGIEEGRLIFENLKKSIAYMLTSNIPEMAPFMVHVLGNIPLPLSVMAILVIDVGTDLWPGISLAYESAEADIMQRKPRDPKVDRLVSWKLIYYTNLNIGVIQACAGFSCYFMLMAQHGFLPSDLLGRRVEWYSEKNDMLDSYGQEWSLFERQVLERKCYSVFFMAIVFTQIADCLICKTRRLSIFEQGMTNMVMNTGLIFELIVACMVIYIPGFNTILRFEPISIETLTPAIPFALFIILFDEGRKYILRKRPGGFFDVETYY